MNEIRENIKINERINFHVPHTALWLLFPIEGIGLLIFLVYVAFHYQQFIIQSVALFNWFVWFAGLALYTGLAFLAVKVIRSLIDAVVAFGEGAANVHRQLIENKQAKARRDLLHTSDNYVVFVQNGQIQVQTVIQERYNYSVRQGKEELEALPSPRSLPTNVLYNDIRDQVPKNHVLIGVGESGLETKDKAVGNLVWIVGLSGTGKTSTTVVRIEERYTDGHKFLGHDPHWFKPDSLTNAVVGYADSFIMPMARNAKEAKKVYQAFLTEFKGRKDGLIPQPWQKITLIVDEVASIMDYTDEDEEEISKMLPSIARICGEEGRNFEMGGIFISQHATGLAWLRKMALMVIVHQLMMDSEKKLAVNGDVEVMQEMKRWPRGRTYCYGVGFGQDGPVTVQQPYFSKPVVSQGWNYEQNTVESSLVDDNGPDTGETIIDENLREAYEAYQNGATGPRALERALDCTYYQAQKLWTQLIEKGLVEAD